MIDRVRPCSQPGDLDKLRWILVEGFRASPQSGYVHLGDLNWWLFYLLGDCALDKIAFLWEDSGGNPVGWSLLSPRYGAFDLFVHPDLRDDTQRVDPMLAWTEERAAQMVRRQREKCLYTMWVFEDDTARMRLLERHGFRRDPDYLMHFLVHPLDMLITPVVPDGFTLRHVIGNGDIASRATAHREAFQSGGMTAEAYRAFQRAPDYRKELDRVVVDPDGMVASYVMAWLDTQNRAGELEPVGTLPDYQRQGLGRAVVLDALRQLKAQGAERVFLYVEHHNIAARGLYASVGFRPVNRILGYMKPV